MDIVKIKQDIWGREVLLGVSWDWLWVVLALTLTAVVVHLLIMRKVSKQAQPSAAGKRLPRHRAIDRLFHWVMAVTVFVLLFTGVLPVIGVDFDWLTIHWIAGLVLTAVIVLHTLRAIFFQDMKSMVVRGVDFAEPFSDIVKPGKYSFAQKGMHHAMTLLVLVVIATGLALFGVAESPWWSRSNMLDEATLGWLFVLHGLSTLGLIALTTLHAYFALRPEKRFYTRSMIKGWISEKEHSSNHDPARWMPDESA